MAKPRRGYVFALDAAVLAAGAKRHRAGDDAFYGLQLAGIMRVEKIVVYRSLRRLTALGLVDRWWEDQDTATALAGTSAPCSGAAALSVDSGHPIPTA